MRRVWSKSVSILLALIMVLSVFSIVPLSAGAVDAGISSFSVTPADAESGAEIRAINWYYTSVDSSYYLFCPETYDKSALKVWFTATDPVMCGNTELISGEVTDVFASGEATLTCAGTSYHVKLLDGGDVGSVQITTESGSMENVHANKSYKDPGTILVTDYDGIVQYDGALDYIKGRGNSTWNGKKKPYNIKLAKKANLFGMGKAKKWCLLANAGDATLMRNLIAYKFAKTIGVDVTSDVIPVNLYCNGEYMGAYSITEKVEIGENRVDIRNLEKDTEELNEADLDTYPLGGDQDTEDADTYQYAQIPNSPEDLSGGYLLELEKIYRYPPEVSGFITSRKQAIVIKEPEYCSQAEVEWMRAYYQEFEDALYSPTGYNAQGKYYTEYVDSESIARMYLAEEFGANFDGCSSSFFLYKDVGGKICAGPAWDFDLSFQQTHGINYLINNTCPLDAVDSLYIQHCYINWDNLSYRSFLGQLFNHNDFQQVVQNVWNEVVKTIYPDFFASIGQTAQRLYSTVVMNAIRWNSYGTTNATSIINNYNNRVKIITDYIPQRYAFLSEAYSDDTFFVKYDTGTYGTELIIDTAIYHSGDTAIVKDLPLSNADYCCSGWYRNGSYTGDTVAPGTAITVTGNTDLYANWTPHQWVQSDLSADWDCCTICGRYRSGSALLEGWNGNYYFKNGVPATGRWETDANGKKYYYGNIYISNRWREIDGKLYYFNNESYAVTGVYPTSKNGSTVYCLFDADGVYVRDMGTEIYGDYFYLNGDRVPYYGLVKFGNDYYYVSDNSKIVRNVNKYLVTTNDLTFADGTPIPHAEYHFNADGKMVIPEGLIGDNFYINGKAVPSYYGLVYWEGNYYYIADNAAIVKNKSKYLTTTNDLCFKDGTPIPHAWYDFDAEGKMLYSKVLIGDFYFVNDVQVNAYYGLVKYENNYYYIGDHARIVRNKSQYLTTTNNLTFSDGTPIPHAYYEFDADGKMKLFTGIKGDYYYINGSAVGSYYGLVKDGGNYYYISDYGKYVRNKNQYLTTTNGLTFADGTPIPHAYYEFDADGKMKLFTGIKGDYYYINGSSVGSYYGLVKDGGSYYYISDYGKIVRNKNQYLTNTNGLTFDGGAPIPRAYYYFDADGKMTIPDGIIGNAYYINGKAVGSYYGLVKWNGDYYYIADNAEIVRNKNKYLTTTNDLCFDDGTPIPHRYYQFDADGKMIY